MKKIAVIGSTGSIGRQTLEVVRRNPDKFKIVSLAAGNNVGEFFKQVKEFSPKAFFQIDEIEINDSIYVEGYPIRVMSRIVNSEDNPGILPLDIEDMNDDNFEIVSEIIRASQARCL